MKIAVHRKNWLHWGGYVVFAGENPLGPRGGRQCNVVAAKPMGEAFKEKPDADAFAQKLATENGWEIV